MSPLDGVSPAVKGALTRAYKEGSSCRVIRSADLVNIPGMKKPPKKRIAAMLEEPVELVEEKSEEEMTSDTDDPGQGSSFSWLSLSISILNYVLILFADGAEDGELNKLRSDLQSVRSKGSVVQTVFLNVKDLAFSQY